MFMFCCENWKKATMLMFSLRSFRIINLCRQPLHTSTILATDHTVSLPEEAILIVEQCDRIRMLGLNRPSKRNALNLELINALRLELKKLEEDDGSVAGLLYGVGGNFCSGIDMEDTEALSQKLPLVDEYCKKPIIASISGYAVGEGFDLAMACDIRVMEEKAVLGVFNRRFGVPMSVSAVNRLVACVGLTIALDLIMTGRPVDTEEAFSKGLVTRHSPCGAGRGEGITAAQQLVKYPQDALLADRATAYQSIMTSEPFLNTLSQERKSRQCVAQKEMGKNCQKFFNGVGKHGTFKNLFVGRDYPQWML